MFFKNICILVLWTKLALALEGLKVLDEVDLSHFLKFLSPVGATQQHLDTPGQGDRCVCV